MRQDRLDAFTRVAAPDAVDVQRRLVQKLDDGICAGLVIDPVIDGEHVEQLLLVAVFESRIDQHRLFVIGRHDAVVIARHEDRVAVLGRQR